MDTGPRRPTRSCAAVVLALVVTFAALAVPAGAVAASVAQDDPGEPHNFYGTAVDEASEPAPEGIEIYALIDGEVEDSIVVESGGEYGGEEAFDDKLTVDDGAGDEVVFTVGSLDGPEALESPYDLSQSDGVTELDLTFPEGAFVEEPPDFQVSIDENASTLEADAGANLSVVATVDNLGEVADTQAVTATVGNDTVGVENLTLDAGANATTEFTFTADSAYDGEVVEVASENDSATATLSVSDDGGSGGTPGGPGDDTGSDTDGGDTGSDDGDDSDGSDGSDDDGTDDGNTDGDETDGSGSETDGTEDDDSDGDDDGDDGTPGFGVLIGAAGVLGSALLLHRRR